MSSDTQEINYEKVKKKKRSPSPIKEKEQSKKSRKDNNNSDSENKIKKRKDRSLSRDDHSDRSYKKKHYDDDDDDNWNKYTRNNVRVGSRYYEPYRQEVCEIKKVKPAKPRVQKKEMDILTRSGGAYIPPAKLKMLQAQITDKSSAAYQRIAWEALKKSIHGHINKVNTTNIGIIVRELFKENIVRGRGLLCRSIIQAQAASPTFTHVYAALVSVINCKFPNIGELLLKRLIIQFRRGFKRNDKSICISAASFIAHLVNQNVAHEILALELLTLLIESPTNDSVEVAIAFLKESGMKLTQVSKKGLQAIFEMLRNILHEGNLEKRVRYMIEVIFQIRKDNFEAHEAVTSELDIVEENDQITHVISLDEIKDGEDILNVFKLDTEYEANELKYTTLKKEILDESSDESGSGEDDDGSDSSEDEEGADSVDKEKDEGVIIDQTETNLVALRRTIYLTIQSSVDFEECAHKLLRMELKPGQESELCHMLLDSCAELRTYEKFFGLLAQRFCVINKIFVGPFENIFGLTYSTIHRLDTNKLRNVAKFFAHLLFTDAISWTVLEKIRLNEEETTSSSRIFIKILFQELSEYMGLTKLNERVKDPTMQSAFDGLFPRDNPKNTRFAINFFTSIGLGGLTDDLREHLKALPKVPIITRIAQNLSSTSSDSSSSDSGTSSSSSGSSSSSSSSSDSSDSESDDGKKKKKKTLTKNKKINESAKKNKSKEKSKDSNKSKNSKEGKSKKHNEDDNDDDDDDVVFLKQKKNFKK